MKASNNDKNIGKQIKKFRISQGMSQVELASILKISYQQLQKYESGQNRITASRLEVIAKILNIHIGVFFRDNQVTSIPCKKRDLEEKRILRLVRLYNSISSDKLRELLLFSASVYAQESSNSGNII